MNSTDYKAEVLFDPRLLRQQLEEIKKIKKSRLIMKISEVEDKLGWKDRGNPANDL